jgi:hypothetical protein
MKFVADSPAWKHIDEARNLMFGMVLDKTVFVKLRHFRVSNINLV